MCARNGVIAQDSLPYIQAEKSAPVANVAALWLAYRFSDGADWAPYIKGDEARKRKEQGVYKDWRVEE